VSEPQYSLEDKVIALDLAKEIMADLMERSTPTQGLNALMIALAAVIQGQLGEEERDEVMDRIFASIRKMASGGRILN
jgi:hypothetical protein